MWEKAEHYRFQELDSDYSDEDGFEVAPQRFRGDNLRFTGYDLGYGKQNTAAYDGLAYGEDYGHVGDDSYHGRTQLEMREKEEELAEKAMRRIHRAKLRGEADVDLSRAELDALERRQMLAPVVAQRAGPSSRNAVKSRKQGTGYFGLGAKFTKSQQNGSRSISNPSSRYAQDIDPPPTATERVVISGSRSASGPARQQASQAPPLFEPQYYSPPSRGSSRQRSSRGSPARSLPDDPDWVPRTRSLPSAQAYQVNPEQWQVSQRRNNSGFVGAAYAMQRRSGAPNAVSLMRNNSSELHRIPSGLSNEVVEISSDDDSIEDVDDAGESDEGVRVVVIPEARASEYGNVGRNRLRKGKR